jgi:leader peptidase (prepilin peptidase)/N-methyltransferase
LVSAIVFAGSYIFWPETVHLGGQWLLLATWLVCSVGLMALAVYDLRWMLLPSKIIYPALAAAVAGQAAYLIAFAPHKWHALVLWICSVAIASGVFWALYTVSKGNWIGYGDVRLGLVTGTLLAHPSKSLLMIFLASLIGTAVTIPALASGRKNLASRLPFGPFLITATAIVVVFGSSIIDWYTHLFGL